MVPACILLDSLRHRFGSQLAESSRPPIPPEYSAAEYSHVARQYLRAICRIYLADFVCLNYTLPSDCNDLGAEFITSVENYRQSPQFRRLIKKDSIWDHLRSVLSTSTMRSIASFACSFAESPECDVEIVHGTNPADEDDLLHDEL